VADVLRDSTKDDPDRNTQAVAALYQAARTGNEPPAPDETKFYILGLAPNAARISVRFWHVATIADVANHILQHFRDTEISRAPYEKPYLSLFRLLSSTAVQDQSGNIRSNLVTDTMRAIIGGTAYPATLLQAAVRRNRADHIVTYPRAALIKACLNRTNRFYTNNAKELTVSLDPTNRNIGYNLGRLFAALEKIQSRRARRDANRAA
jgi:CRISPR-associated protein Csd1